MNNECVLVRGNLVWSSERTIMAIDSNNKSECFFIWGRFENKVVIQSLRTAKHICVESSKISLMNETDSMRFRRIIENYGKKARE
jgi:hypothetical protein